VTKDQIILNIAALKSHSSINYGIKTKVQAFTEKLFYTLFDANDSLTESVEELEKSFKEISKIASKKPQELCDDVWSQFLEKLPCVLEKLNMDAEYILENDPASNSVEEVCLGYPGFYAIAIYRLSHELYLLDMLLFSRLMSEYAHQITGTDIHAGATIASPFFIDHATGIVIGETTVIEKALIERNKTAPAIAGQLAALADGNYREALMLVQHAEEDWQELVRNWLNAILKTGPVAQTKWVEEVAKLGREKQKQFLRYFNHLLEQAVHYRIQGENLLISEKEKDFAARLNRIAGFEQQEAMMHEIDQAHYHVERNANAKILFHALTIKLYHIIQDNTVLLLE